LHITAGTKIGSYEIVDALGAGGMGHVYRATDTRLGREIAIKTLPAEVAKDAGALARFEREARFLAALNHPNIASIYGVEEWEGERFLVLELVPGETLDAIVARGPLPLRDALRIAGEVANGLEAAHEAGIIHRDLKPSNVRVTPSGHVKILDFGIAKAITPHPADMTHAATMESDLTRAGGTVGTPAYMSPEQFQGGDVDRRTDVWSFGCLLYEMLTGRRPFDGRTYLELADAIRHTEPDWSALPRDTPPHVQQVIGRCLRKDPRERLHDIADVRLELREAVAVRVEPPRAWARSAIAALIAIVVIGLLVWSLRRTSAPESRPASVGALKLSSLTFDEGVEQFPSWSPDGKSIAYAGEVQGLR
jgi:serine/threonine protein kinase